MTLQYTFTRQFLLWGPTCPQTPQRGHPPSALPRMEECTYFWGVNTSWGINTAKSKRPLNQEDNQAPQPTLSSSIFGQTRCRKSPTRGFWTFWSHWSHLFGILSILKHIFEHFKQIIQKIHWNLDQEM